MLISIKVDIIPASSCTSSLADTFANRYCDHLKLAQDSSQNCPFKEMLPIFLLLHLVNIRWLIQRFLLLPLFGSLVQIIIAFVVLYHSHISS